MKNFLYFLGILFLFSINSCKDKNDIIDKDPNTELGSVRIISTDPKLKVGLIQRAPKLGCDVIAYGPKDINGYLKDVERVIIYEPTSEDWIDAKFEKGAPTSIETKKGLIIIFENYNFSDQTVNAKIIEKSSNKVIGQKNQIKFSNELKDNILHYRKLNGSRLAATAENSPICDPNTRKAIDLVTLVANAAFCGISIGATLTSGGLAALLFGLQAIQACFGVFDGFVELVADQSVIEYYFGETAKCNSDAALAGVSLSSDCWESITMAAGKIIKCSLSILDAGNKGAGCGCEKDEDDQKEKAGHSFADPHLLTSDGLNYDFQGYGEFIACKSTVDNFEIQVRQEGNKEVPYFTVNTAIAIQTGQDIVSIHCRPFELYVNNTKINMPTSTMNLKENASISPYLGSSRVFDIVTSNNDLIRVRNYGSLIDYELYLNKNRKGKVEGLLGNFDGKKENDLAIRNGNIIENSWDNIYPTFANSWRVKEKFLLHYQDGKDTQSHTVFNFPIKRIEVTPEVLETSRNACLNAGVFEEPFLSNCIYDYSLTNDQNLIASALTTQNISLSATPTNEINEYKDIVLTASKLQATPTDSCLLDYTNGKVYQLKDGAKYADKVDAILLFYCGLRLDPPSYVMYCDGSCGTGPVNRVLKEQNWSVYRTGGADPKLSSDDPYNDQNIPASEWANITTSSDLARLSWKGAHVVTPTNYQFGSRIAITSKGNPLGVCNPDTYYKFTLYRFITKEGKKGVFRIKKMIISENGYKITLDIKVQK